MRVQIRPSFLLYGACVALFASVEACIGVIAALTVHELAHWVVAIFLGEHIERVEITPFGGVMTYRHTPKKGVTGMLVALAGPLANYMAIVIVSQVDWQGYLSHELIRQLLNANLAMMLLNIMPVLPLDGGSVLFSLGYFVFRADRLIKLLSACGGLLGCFFWVAGLYGVFFHRILNLSLWIIGAYLLMYARKSREILLSENLYAIVRERMAQPALPRRLTMYQVDVSMSLVAAAKLMSQTSCALFLIEDNGAMHVIGESAVCSAMLQSPQSEIASLLQAKK